MIFGKNVNRYYLKYWYLLLIGCAALLMVNLAQLDIPKYIGEMVDGINDIIKVDRALRNGEDPSVFNPLTIERLKEYIKALLIIMVIMFVGRFTWRITIFGLGVKVATNMRDRLFLKNEMLSTKYYSTHKTGAIMAIYTNDIQMVQNCFGMGIIMAFDAVVFGGLVFYRMFRLNPTLALIASVPLLILGLAGKVVGDHMNKKWSDRQKAYEQLSDFTQEAFSGISVIKAFVKEASQLIRFKKINQNNQAKNIAYIRYATLLEVLLTLFLGTMMILVIFGASFLIYQSKINPEAPIFTVGRLTEFMALFGSLTWPMMAISHIIGLTSQGLASLKRINQVFDFEIEINDRFVTEAGKNAVITGEITFNHFNLIIDQDQVILKDLNITIQKGQMIGIIGKTGSGKSKFIDSIMRFYNFEPNTLLLDGVDILEIPLEKLRDNIAYVPQDSFLFSDTISNNIGLGLNQINQEQIEKYAKLAAVDDNIQEFTHKYQTILGERGVTISGGQKQRISIARALIKEAPILILDDSVSAVDTKTEEKILRNLKQLRSNQTTLIIAHRITTIKELDKIIFLENGQITGFATHQELLKTSPGYQEIYRLQQLAEASLEGDN